MLNERNLQVIETELALLTAAKDTAVTDLETCIAMVREQLEQRKNDLMNSILDQFKAKQTVILDKQKQYQEANELLRENITEAKRITSTGNLCNLKHMNERLKKCNEEIHSLPSLDLGENYLMFESDKGKDEFKKSFNTLGKVYTKGFLPSMIAFRSQHATAGHEAAYKVEVYNHQGEAISISSGAFSLQVTDQADTELDTTVLNTDGSECTVTFTPQMGGLHEVSGMFLGQQLMSEHTHIPVSSNNPVLKFGDKGYGKGAFGMLGGPWSIAIDKSKYLYVADSGNQLIQKFRADGKFLKQFRVSINERRGSIKSTCDIAVDHDKGRILCPQTSYEAGGFIDGNNLLEFTLGGHFKKIYVLSDEWKAFGIAIDGHGDIILSNSENQCLFKVDKKGKFLDVVGPSISPGFIAIADDGTIIVPDENDDCVYLINADGSVKHTFGSFGKGKGELDRPFGIATDNEYILVSDTGNNRVQVFKRDGTFVSMIESTEDPLDSPRGLAVTKDGYVYVVDSGHKCIKKYKYRDIQW